LERVNREVKRRTEVVGVFPNPAALLRPSDAVFVEIHNEWAASERRYLSEASMKLITIPHHDPEEVAKPGDLTA
jgi:putative transposase